MSRSLTRVCQKCKRRKSLALFRRPSTVHRYGETCHACSPEVLPTLRTKRCVKCRHRKYLREFGRKYGRQDHRLDTRCKSCRSKYDRQRHGSRAAAVCIDCGEPSHFRRCEVCRGKHQAAAELVLGVASRSPKLCGLPTRTGACGQALSFGTDFLGRTTSWCIVHGEYLVPVIGVRHYDQRAILEDELDGFIERTKLAPKVQGTSAARSGMFWRQRTNEYLTRGVA